MRSPESDLAERLREAIARRDALRPGTPAQWRAACEARALMKQVVAEFTQPPSEAVQASAEGAPAEG